MAIFHFLQFEYELFCWYFKCLNAFLAKCGYCLGKWKILCIIHEGVNNETWILLQFWDFHGKSVDEAWCLLEWVAWDSFEFKKASCVSGYSFHKPCAFYSGSYYAPFWFHMCNSSVHNVSLCSYYVYYAHSDSSLPLTQNMMLEVGEHFGLGASLGMKNALLGLEDTFDMEHTQVDTPLAGCRDGFMHEESPSLVKMFSPVPLSIPMFLPFVHNLHFPLSILMMCRW